MYLARLRTVADGGKLAGARWKADDNASLSLFGVQALIQLTCDWGICAPKFAIMKYCSLPDPVA